MGGKALAFGSLLLGFCLAALLSLTSTRYTEESAVAMAATPSLVKQGAMQAYSPFNGKNDDIRKQIEFMIRNKWTPCLEISGDGDIYLNTAMGPGYYDNRYWSLYKLPMFGCRDPNDVVRAIESCKSDFPQAKIRVIGFDSTKQVQTAGFIVRK